MLFKCLEVFCHSPSIFKQCQHLSLYFTERPAGELFVLKPNSLLALSVDCEDLQ